MAKRTDNGVLELGVDAIGVELEVAIALEEERCAEGRSREDEVGDNKVVISYPEGSLEIITGLEDDEKAAPCAVIFPSILVGLDNKGTSDLSLTDSRLPPPLRRIRVALSLFPKLPSRFPKID